MTVTSERSSYDAVVIGAGPNGLSAAITLAREGLSVLVVEQAETVGGGARTAELTLPGFAHDVCSAFYPLGAGSPFFHTLPLEEHGLEWVNPPSPVAHPFDDGTAAVLRRSVDATAYGLDEDTAAYRDLMQPLVDDWAVLAEQILGPLRPPRHPIALARFGLRAFRSARGLADAAFKGERARALLAGLGAHSMQSLDAWGTAVFALVLAVTGHVVGWPLARGGSQRISDALASYLRSLGGEIVTATRVESIDELPAFRAVMLDVTPRQLLAIAGSRLPVAWRRRLQRYRYGAAASKVDWALSGPIPWRAPECAEAGTVHLGGTLEEIAASAGAVATGAHPERPFVLVGQQSLFDPTRAPEGKHTVWAYCHVPNGSTFDMTDRIEGQIERFAPGFRDLLLARSVRPPAVIEGDNPNYVGGDINGGVQDLRQMFTRPTLRASPYSTPTRGIYICSSSTPPGGGVHGMCGYHAARAALRREF